MSLTARAVGRIGVLAVLVSAGLSACGDNPPPTKPAASMASDKPRKVEAVLPPEMVAAVSAGKVATQIGVHFALQAAPAVGKPLPVEIAIVPHRPFTSVRALFDAPDALSMQSGKRLEPLADVKAEVVLSHRLALQPTQDGVFLITAAVETEGEDGAITRIYYIPVIVGATAAPTTPPAPATSTG